MRLAEISDDVLDDYDLDRREARQEARAGQLWATPDRQRVAVAPTGAAALWMLGVEHVQRVQCSTMDEATIATVLARRVIVGPALRALAVSVTIESGAMLDALISCASLTLSRAVAAGMLPPQPRRVGPTAPLGEVEIGSAWADFLRLAQRAGWDASRGGTAPAAEQLAVDNHVEALRDVAWSQRYTVPARERRLSVDAIYDAMQEYTEATGQQPTLLRANRFELREAVRGQLDPGWAEGIEAGRWFGMRLDLTAPPGEWSVGAEP